MIIAALITGILGGFCFGLWVCGKVVAKYRHEIEMQKKLVSILEDNLEVARRMISRRSIDAATMGSGFGAQYEEPTHADKYRLTQQARANGTFNNGNQS